MIREDFLRLLARKLSDGLSPAEEDAYQEAIRSNQAYARYAHELGKEDPMSHEQDGSLVPKLEEVWQRIDITEDRVIRLAPANWLSMAVIFLVVMGATLLLYHYYGDPQDYWPGPLHDRWMTLTTTSQKQFATLDDGTKVSLNRKSSIRYNRAFGASSRVIHLRGEAFFDVAKQPDIPLSIEAGPVTIRVLGTSFNVKADETTGKLEVALIQGSVEVSANFSKHHRIVRLKPHEKLRLYTHKGEKAGDFEVLSIHPWQIPEEIGWAQDSIVFKKQKLKDLAIQLEKKFSVRISIRKAALKDKRFSGTFTGTSVRDALEALKISYPFDYQLTDSIIIIQ